MLELSLGVVCTLCFDLIVLYWRLDDIEIGPCAFAVNQQMILAH